MKWIPWVLVAMAVLLSAVLYSRLPESLPVHWNAAGEIDRYESKQLGALLMPLIMIITAVIFEAVPRISPSGFTLDANERGFRAIAAATMALLFAVHVCTLLVGLGVRVDMNRVMPIGCGLLFAIIGNYMATVRKNFFVGIRTPWTLANDDVWFRTHRLGGRLFMGGGLALIGTAFLEPKVMAAALLTIIVIVAAIPIVYSYVIYRKLEGDKR